MVRDEVSAFIDRQFGTAIATQSQRGRVPARFDDDVVFDAVFLSVEDDVDIRIGVREANSAVRRRFDDRGVFAKAMDTRWLRILPFEPCSTIDAAKLQSHGRHAARAGACGEAHVA